MSLILSTASILLSIVERGFLLVCAAVVVVVTVVLTTTLGEPTVVLFCLLLIELDFASVGPELRLSLMTIFVSLVVVVTDPLNILLLCEDVEEGERKRCFLTDKDPLSLATGVPVLLLPELLELLPR